MQSTVPTYSAINSFVKNAITNLYRKIVFKHPDVHSVESSPFRPTSPNTEIKLIVFSIYAKSATKITNILISLSINKIAAKGLSSAKFARLNQS